MRVQKKKMMGKCGYILEIFFLKALSLLGNDREGKEAYPKYIGDRLCCPAGRWGPGGLQSLRKRQPIHELNSAEYMEQCDGIKLVIVVSIPFNIVI